MASVKTRYAEGSGGSAATGNYYQVRTLHGEVFEIYYDRGTSLKHPERKKWFLHRQL